MTSVLLSAQHKEYIEDAKSRLESDAKSLTDEEKTILGQLVAGEEGYTPAKSPILKLNQVVRKKIKDTKRDKKDKDFFSPTSKNAKQSLTESEFEKKEERRKKATEGYGGGRNKGGLMRKGKK